MLFEVVGATVIGVDIDDDKLGICLDGCNWGGCGRYGRGCCALGKSTGYSGRDKKAEKNERTRHGASQRRQFTPQKLVRHVNPLAL